MTAQKSGGSDNQSGSHQPAWTQEQGSQPEQQPLARSEIGAWAARTAQAEQWMSEQKVLGHQRCCSTGPGEECAQAARQLMEDQEKVLHGGKPCDHAPASPSQQAALAGFLQIPIYPPSSLGFLRRHRCPRGLEDGVQRAQ